MTKSQNDLMTVAEGLAPSVAAEIQAARADITAKRSPLPRLTSAIRMCAGHIAQSFPEEVEVLLVETFQSCRAAARAADQSGGEGAVFRLLGVAVACVELAGLLLDDESDEDDIGTRADALADLLDHAGLDSDNFRAALAGPDDEGDDLDDGSDLDNGDDLDEDGETLVAGDDESDGEGPRWPPLAVGNYRVIHLDPEGFIIDDIQAFSSEVNAKKYARQMALKCGEVAYVAEVTNMVAARD